MNCTNCGAPLQADEARCPACGQPIPRSETPAEPGPVGWSNKFHDPAIQKASQRQKRSAKAFALIFGLIFPVGFAAAGVLLPTLDFWPTLLIGLGLGLLMASIGLLRLWSLSRPLWEGVVADKSFQQTMGRKGPKTRYTVVFKGKTRGSRRLRFGSPQSLYDYFSLGDRVRWYPVFGTYEKFDKSRDTVIFCNVCSAENPMANRKCQRCKAPLFR